MKAFYPFNWLITQLGFVYNYEWNNQKSATSVTGQVCRLKTRQASASCLSCVDADVKKAPKTERNLRRPHPLDLCAAQQTTTARERSHLDASLPASCHHRDPSGFRDALTCQEFLPIGPVLFGGFPWVVAGGSGRVGENHLQSQQIPLTPSNVSQKYQQCHKRTCACGFFHNDEMGTD